MPDVPRNKAKRFLNKLFDSFGSDEKSNALSPGPPIAGDYHNSLPKLTSNKDLVDSFKALELSGTHQYHSDPDFVGGFHPHYTDASQSYAHDYSVMGTTTPPKRPPSLTAHYSSPAPGPLPRPPAMSMPAITPQRQSLTMQMALLPQAEEGPYLPLPPPRPHSASVLPVPSFNLAHGSVSHPVSNSVSSKPKHERPRAPSNQSTSSDQSRTTQCAGVTKAGKRCTRQVKTGPVPFQAYNNEEGDNIISIERFCFQHTKELLGPSGYYARKDGKWINFEDWVPDYLQPSTQVALRVEMEKARSQSDVPGYIYTFEIRDSEAVDTIKLKVGRAVNLVKRIDQWGKQCSSKEQVLRGWYPGTVEVDERGSLMKGRVIAGEKGAWCHRLERLVHLELADLATTGIYLDPAWPQSSFSTGTLKSAGNVQTCADCGSVHKEIFEFTRFGNGPFKGQEWERVVKPVIEKWGSFVDTFV